MLKGSQGWRVAIRRGFFLDSTRRVKEASSCFEIGEGIKHICSKNTLTSSVLIRNHGLINLENPQLALGLAKGASRYELLLSEPGAYKY